MIEPLGDTAISMLGDVMGKVFPTENCPPALMKMGAEVISQVSLSRSIFAAMEIIRHYAGSGMYDDLWLSKPAVLYGILASVESAYSVVDTMVEQPTNEESAVQLLNDVRQWTNDIMTSHPLLEKLRPVVKPLATAASTLMGGVVLETGINVIDTYLPGGVARDLASSLLHNPNVKAGLFTTWMIMSRASVNWLSTPYVQNADT